MKISMIVFNTVWNDPRVRREATSTFKKGIETIVLGLKDFDYNKEKVNALPFPVSLIEIDSKYYRPSRTFFTIVRREFIIYYKFIKECIKAKPDIIHANDLNALPVAYFSAKFTKSKIVYDSHEIFTENDFEGKNTRKIFWEIVEKFLIKRVDQVLSVSNSAATELSQMYNIEKPTIITNCVARVNKASLKEKSIDGFEVLYHGKFYKGRGYEAFIKAAVLLKDFPSIRLVLRGLGAIEHELRMIAKELNLYEKIRFDPPVDVTELVKSASSSHVGVVLTEPINKNFIYTVSNKLFEYINAGLPVILSDVPEHRYLNNKYKFGIIIDEVTSYHIAEAILKIYKDKSLYQNLCDNAKRTADILNWETESEKLMNVYYTLSKKNNNLVEKH